jgi:probable addiction module antidote protein
MTTGKTTKHAASVAFRAADYIHGDAELAVFLKELLADGDARMIPVALRTAADVLGMTELARRTGLSRETLYRTLSSKGNPRLDTLSVILAAFGLRLDVAPVRAKSRRAARAAHA